MNRRQHHPAERKALASYRAGDIDASVKTRTDHGWEHQEATPADTRQGLAHAATVDADRHGAEHVAVLAVSHADCEDLADRIRAIRAARAELRGPILPGPATPAPTQPGTVSSSSSTPTRSAAASDRSTTGRPAPSSPSNPTH